MADLVANCPRCDAKHITFHVGQISPYKKQYGWQTWYEAFAICKKCHRSTIFLVSDHGTDESKQLHSAGLSGIMSALNDFVDVEGYVSISDLSAKAPPEHLPEKIQSVFQEGAKSLAIDCYNAAGAMFRLCIDLATKGLLPKGEKERPNAATCRSLGLRLGWLFDNNLLPEALRDLAQCVKDDGNDGAHDGTLTEPDAENLFDFTYELLERLYTEPKKLELAKLRREKRRSQPVEQK